MCARNARAAGDLYVDACISQSVAFKECSADIYERPCVKAHNSGEFQTSCEPRLMKVKCHANATKEPHQLIDAIAKQESAIKHTDLGVFFGDK